MPSSRRSQVKVLYGGTELFDDEVRHTFRNDMMLAVISGACITLLVYLLTSFSGTGRPAPRSIAQANDARVSIISLFSRVSVVFLTFFGLASIGLSCLMALFLYHAVFGVRYLGILNGVAAFVIIGIGEENTSVKSKFTFKYLFFQFSDKLSYLSPLRGG